jgi:hypothetical protein
MSSSTGGQYVRTNFTKPPLEAREGAPMNPIQRKCIHCGEPVSLTTWGGWMHRYRAEFYKPCRRKDVQDMIAEPERDR